jgi:hypothetical protein
LRLKYAAIIFVVFAATLRAGARSTQRGVDGGGVLGRNTRDEPSFEVRISG